MCGIFGYVNWHVNRTMRDILVTLLEGLQRVEYRGYDSAGLCIDSPQLSEPFALARTVGNIACLREEVSREENSALLGVDRVLNVHAGIAHTRWATHGAPAVKNCHPQVSNNRQFAIVHNGIITNFMPLRQMLLDKGYHFTSDTDTEVMAVLAEDLYKQDPSLSFSQLTVKMAHMTEGAYAILLKSAYYPNELVACRKSSPLALGIRHCENTTEKNGATSPCEIYFASDINSFSAYTNSVIFLEDDDIAHFSEGKLSFYTTCGLDMEAKPVTRNAQIVNNTQESFSKGNYEHFMIKEIHEQVETVARSMHGRVNFDSGAVTLDGFDESVIAEIRTARRILLIACGTSYHSCLAARPIFEELLPEIPIAIENAADFLDRHPSVSRRDVFIFVSQSGETADTLVAMQLCKEGGALLIGLTNVVGSSVLRMSNYSILLRVGVEVGVASTKAYTAQIVVLILLALLLCQPKEGTADSERLKRRRTEIVAGLATLSGSIAQCIKSTRDAIMELARKWKDISSLLIIGRGYDFATALESALKVKEVSYIYTEGIHSGELKHGPLALIDKESVVVAFCPHDRHFEKSMSALQQVTARGGHVVGVTTKADDLEIKSVTDYCLEVPKVVDCLQGIVNVVPLQLLSYYLALSRGLNIDCPRNLAKSVTVQ